MVTLRCTVKVGLAILAASTLFQTQSCKPPQNKPGQKVTAASPKDIYAEHIRSTGFKTPEEERLSFVLPEGFEVTLFASEPDITKPMNMEFDDRGRLWVTQSSEYPVAAGTSDGKDRITILEDRNGDGRADIFTHFDDNLNIPIGIMPVADGAIAYSIPNLYHFKDLDNDGKADSREILLAGFGHKDTHGMVNNLMRGYDGWLHVCHGFSNISTVAGTDGDSIRMTSGNTFRVKMDGSHVAQTTFGRVNPFGYAYDEKGYLYSVDCHTKPITQLIFGGEYPHFGKKAPVGLGFAPTMMTYDLGSTALAGLVYYTGRQFPAEYRNSFFTGDVVTCRIDRNTITFIGSTPSSKKEEPFLVSKDPWFRPVDIKVGPDGALYIADFYNRIIGHYEVALNHPGRDRVSGRIWKVAYKGNKPHENLPVTDWSKATIGQLLQGLRHPQLNTRLKVADRLVDTWREKAVGPLRGLLNADTDPATHAHALWILHRLGVLDDGSLDHALAHHDAGVRIHALRILNERPAISDAHYVKTTEALTNGDPFVRRTAAEVLTHFTKAESLALLMALYEKTPEEDTHLRYTALLGVRDNLKNPGVMWRLPAMHWNDRQLALINRALLDVPSSAGASFLLDYTLTHELAPKELLNNLEYIGRLAAPYQIEKAIDLITTRFANEPETQLSLFRTIQTGIRQGGTVPSAKMIAWGEGLAGKFLENVSGKDKESAAVLKQRVTAAEIAGEYRFKSLEPALRAILQNSSVDPVIRGAAAGALMNIDPRGNVNVLAGIFNDPSQTPALREKLAIAMGQAASPSVFETLKKQLASGARNLQIAIATVLSNSSEGIGYLLNAFKDDDLAADIAVETAVQERLTTHANAAQQGQMRALLAIGAKEREERQKLIDDRIANFKPATAFSDAGKVVFVQNCSGCHQIQGSGGMVGPQLDGIGNWGHKALTQKILDPNRNITEAFRTYNITLKNDKTLTGLYRRTEGETMVFADMAGQEFSVVKGDLKEYRASKYTLMPDQFRNIIPEKDFYALLDYLLGVK
ncbi:hypothetical protein GCM10010967_05610 [Dyadobacter beijingensis]|uniref:Cytochrome c domain-containing protein n=1 Tax=Dyadobacter beijingensis TaxID=365489 RepID=A0ABQ2HD89_9BACT|nr:PVC-type heme-binding CxxCH protein [Dyadobacter beijingensis]GGM76899.1 hypothetical protein GCM10010967_05610 [Dyadobacter beijingensis]